MYILPCLIFLDVALSCQSWWIVCLWVGMPRCLSVCCKRLLASSGPGTSPHATVLWWMTLNMCPMAFLLRIHQECVAGTWSLHNFNSITQTAFRGAAEPTHFMDFEGSGHFRSSPVLVMSVCAHSGPCTWSQASLYPWRPGHRMSLSRQQWGQCVLSTQLASPQNGLGKQPWNSHPGCPSCQLCNHG